MKHATLDDCRFHVEGNGAEIVLGNSRIRRVWRLSGGILRSVSVRDEATGLEHGRDDGSAPNAFLYQGYLPVIPHRKLYHPLRLASASARVVPRSIFSGAHLEAVLRFVEPQQGLSIRLIHWIFTGVPAIRSVMEVQAENHVKGHFYPANPLRACEALPLAQRLTRFEAHEFRCRTDVNVGSLRTVRRGAIAGVARPCDGNIVLLEDGRGRGMFVLKEHPPRDEQRPEVSEDFRIGEGMLLAMGWGLMPWEFSPDRHRRSYGWTVGVYEGGTFGAARALREYQDARYVPDTSRDGQFMVNCFGNGRWGKGLTERFLRRDVAAAAAVGIPIYQADDGWQQGHRLGNLERVRQNLILPADAWRFRKDRFPRGLAPVTLLARRLGMRLGLWYSPDLHRQYRRWREEADCLLDLWRKSGVEFFKIDTVQLRCKDADERLEALLKAVRRESRGRVSFNLDITTGWRWGYFQFAEYGNFFLENRMTRDQTYRPWQTLRNLWQLSLFVPTRQLQIEIPDVSKDAAGYSRRDPTRPEVAGQAYAAAVALFASPLFWGEVKGLPRAGQDEMRAVAGLWRRLHREILEGSVFPIGSEPDGRSFTGFQAARRGNRGLAIFYRECNPSARHAFVLRDVCPGRYRVTPLWPEGEARTVRFGREARLTIGFDRPHDFRVVRYEPFPQEGREGLEGIA